MQRRSLLLPLAMLAALPAFANLELTVATHSTMKPARGVIVPKGVELVEQAALRVTLGTGFHRVDHDGGTEIADFAKRRIYRSDRSTGSVTDRSLFAVVGGRDVELDNRIYLGKVSAQLNSNQDHFALPYQEHELSLHREGMPVAKIDEKAAGGEKRYLWERSELAAWSKETHSATPAERTAFARFVRYQFGAHPTILTALVGLEGIPKWLRLSQPRWGRTTQIDVTGVRRTPDAPYVPLEGEEKFEDAELGAIVKAARASTPQSRKAARDAIVAEAVRAAESNLPLAAAAGFLEASLMLDEPLPPQAYAEEVKEAPDVRAFFGTFRSLPEEEAKAAIATLTRLQMTAQRKAYVLAIYRAYHQQGLGDYQAAFRDYQAVLKGNPLLAGTWTVLGKLFLSRYQAEEAWLCWDLARRIDPSHPMLGEVEKLEARLLQQYPEYF